MSRPGLVLGLFVLLATMLCAADGAVSPEFRRAHPWSIEPHLRFQRGDNPEWARPEFDDGGWRQIGWAELPSRDGVYWVRTRVTVPEQNLGEPVDAVALAVIASYELYWDGHLVGRSGVVGRNRVGEVPGRLDQVFRLPDILAQPGEHVVALRLSSFRTGFPSSTYGLKIGLTSQRSYFTARAEAAAYSIIAFGGTAVMAIVFLLLWLLVRRRADTLLFALLCAAAMGLQGLQVWRGLYYYTYDWHRFRVLWLLWAVSAIGVLLMAFVTTFCRVPRRWVWIAAVVAVHGAAWVPTLSATLLIGILSWTAVGPATLLAAWSAWRGERHAIAIVAGLLVTCVSLARGPVEFLEHAFYYGFGASILGCATALVLQLRADRQAAHQARLTAARLEIELLKKNIQPHFVLNTLTTLTEVIEQEPKTAVALIEALAAEFRLLAHVSGKRLIPLREELQLCHEHLRVMSLRQDVRYLLRVENADGKAMVPPALFLTLVENAVTHATRRGGELEFVLRAQAANDRQRYEFVAPWVPGPDAASASRPQIPVRQPDEGTGSRYVKARLEESFAGHWTFQSGPTSQGWETVIEFDRPVVEESYA